MAQQPAHELDSQEQDDVVRIATSYFRSVSKDEHQAQKMLSGLAKIVQDQGAKLVHIGDVLFLVMVRSQGVVEIHTIGTEKQPRLLAEDFKKLVPYLKNIGVKTAYTYTPDKKFGRLAQMTGLAVKPFETKMGNTPITAYVLEL